MATGFGNRVAIQAQTGTAVVIPANTTFVSRPDLVHLLGKLNTFASTEDTTDTESVPQLLLPVVFRDLLVSWKKPFGAQAPGPPSHRSMLWPFSESCE